MDSAILYKKKIYHSEVVSVVDIDRCNWVSLVCLGKFSFIDVVVVVSLVDVD